MPRQKSPPKFDAKKHPAEWRRSCLILTTFAVRRRRKIDKLPINGPATKREAVERMPVAIRTLDEWLRGPAARRAASGMSAVQACEAVNIPTRWADPATPVEARRDEHDEVKAIAEWFNDPDRLVYPRGYKERVTTATA